MNHSCVNCSHWDGAKLNARYGQAPCRQWSTLAGQGISLLVLSGRGQPLLTPPGFNCNSYEPSDAVKVLTAKKAKKKEVAK